MPNNPVVLIQKPDSPYRSLLENVLVQECGPLGWRRFGAEALDLAAGQVWGVLWDLHGHQMAEIEALGGVLAQAQVGVVLACGRLDGPARRAMELSGALALLVDPEAPHEVAAALEVAGATLERLRELVHQRDSLARELEDRLVVEKAKRLLMRRHGLGEAQAMRQLQQQSRRHNLKLAQVAAKVLETEDLFDNDGS